MLEAKEVKIVEHFPVIIPFSSFISAPGITRALNIEEAKAEIRKIFS